MTDEWKQCAECGRSDREWQNGYDTGCVEEGGGPLQDANEEIEKLKQQLKASHQVKAFLVLQLKDLHAEQNLAEMIGLGKDTGTDVAIIHMAEQWTSKLEEIEKLKERNAEVKIIGGEILKENKKLTKQVSRLSEAFKKKKEEIKKILDDIDDSVADCLKRQITDMNKQIIITTPSGILS